MKADPWAIECLRLSKSFSRHAILQEVSFKVKPGTVMALVGSNGAGKTTLMKILTGLLTPSRGTAQILGRDVQTEPLAVKKLMGFVSAEERSFYWRLTGRGNLNFFGALHGMSKVERTNRIDTLIQASGFEQAADKVVRECSTGMKQVLGILRGMLHDPPVLVLDEPTRSLAPDTAVRIRRMIRAEVENKGKTVLIASHNLGEVENIADEITLLHQGRICATGTLTSLTTQWGTAGHGNLEHVFQQFMGELEAGCS